MLKSLKFGYLAASFALAVIGCGKSGEAPAAKSPDKVVNQSSPEPPTEIRTPLVEDTKAVKGPAQTVAVPKEIDLTQSTKTVLATLPAEGTSPHAFNVVFQLEALSVTASPASFQGQTHWTYVPTFKVKRLSASALPAAAQDLWAWVVYVSGDPAPTEVGDLMLSRLGWKDPPAGLTFSVSQTSPRVDETRYRSGRAGFEVTFKEPNAQAVGHDVVLYSLILSPEKVDQRWNAATEEISLPIQGYDFDKLMKVLTTGKPPQPVEQRGVAVICLCGFADSERTKSQLVILSQPLVLTFDAKTE